jgi:predicted P-loop ATPase
MAGVDRSAENPFLIEALKCAKRGWHVLPCRPGEKPPATKHGYKDATADPGAVVRSWKRNPRANVGIATGSVSGVFVLDVDPRNGGDKSLAELERLHGDLPATVTAETGSGGRHYYFRLPDGVELGCSVLADGIDLKGNRGHVVAPPSVLEKGGRYTWLVSPEQQELAPIPKWLLSAAKTKQSKSSREPSAGKQPDAADSPLGRLFDERSLLGPRGEGGKRLVVCPWQNEHSGGRLLDTSTVIFPADHRNRLGAFKCLHSHCDHRTGADAFRELERQRRAGSAETEWMCKLKRNKHGDVESSFGNCCLILDNDPMYGSLLRLNEMTGSVLHNTDETGDHFISQVRLDLEERYALKAPEPETVRAVLYAATKRKFHPVREFLEGLVWDGTSRIHRVAAEILHAQSADSDEAEIQSLLLVRWFIGLVRRPMEPGVKFDTTLIIQGAQGTGKSTFFRVIAEPWFSDSDMSLDKDGMMQMGGTWIYEWPELETVMGRNHVSKVKAYITSSIDRFRPPYARAPIAIPRSGVIVGTTNLYDFLRDPTGSRRFWVIQAGNVNIPLLRESRQQLLAEAVHRCRQGEPHWLSDAEEERRAQLVGAFGDTDPWEEPVLRYVRPLAEVRLAELLANPIGISRDRQGQRDLRRVADILRRAGFQPGQRRANGEQARVWIPPGRAGQAVRRP